MKNQNVEVKGRQFDYGALCKEQAISVSIPPNTVVDAPEVDELLDIALKGCRIFNKVERLKQICLTELLFAKNNEGQYHAITFTSDVADESNRIYQDLERAGGLMDTVKKLSNRELSTGYQAIKITMSTPVNIVYTQTRNILTFLINKNTQYQKYGSSEGYSPNLAIEDAASILEKCVHMQNYLYDLLYVVGTVALGTLAKTHGPQTPNIVKEKLIKYSVFENEHARALQLIMTSFKPEARFVVGESEDVIFNL